MSFSREMSSINLVMYRMMQREPTPIHLYNSPLPLFLT